MATKQKNILDFRNTSQRLFIATWALMIFAILATLLSSSGKQNTTNNNTFASIIPFLVVGIIAAIGSYACKKMLSVISDRKKAIRESNVIHVCQILLLIISFLFLACFMLALVVCFFMFSLQSQYGDNPSGTITRQYIVDGVIQIIFSTVLCVIYLACYMKTVITSDVARKDFSNLSKTTSTKKVKKETRPTQKVEAKISSDDSDEDDL